MYEAMTFDFLLEKMLACAPESVDKREGSILYDALAPAAAELCQMYIALDGILMESFADTATREFLVRRVIERGIKPYEATSAQVEAVFNTEVPLKSRFLLGDQIYEVLEKMEAEGFCYRLICLQKGSAANHLIGSITPTEYIEGLETGEITQILIPGEEEEETEGLRKRYFNSFNNNSYGGNRFDYTEKINAIAGVGAVKLTRAWQGGGTVKATIINSEFCVPSQSLIETVQTIVDPVINGAEGLGIAPIGHRVSVEGVEQFPINIHMSVVYESGWHFEDLKDRIYATIDNYFLELAKEWAENDTLIVRISQMESRLLELKGIVDISDTLFNAEAKNLTVGAGFIPVRGEVVG